MAIIGSGNWGSAIAKIIARNVLDRDEFDDKVTMWVYQEQIDGRDLTDIINKECVLPHLLQSSPPATRH